MAYSTISTKTVPSFTILHIGIKEASLIQPVQLDFMHLDFRDVFRT